MIKVVIDTNVIVSAAISGDGNPALIFEMFLFEEIINYITQEILEEMKDVLARPRISARLKPLEQEFIIGNFERFSIKIAPLLKLEIIKEDPDDNKFLECAVTASADYIISGDEHLQKLKEFRGIKIVNPAEFIQIMHKD